MAEQVTTHMTAAEFSQIPETNQLMELINGVVVVSPSPVSRHQDIIVRLILLLGRIIDNGKVVVAPMDVYLDDINVFQPDVFWLAEESQCVDRDGYYYGAPELTIEVHSPSTSSHDKRDKFDKYEEHGVHEYWMVDPIGEHIEVWQRHDDRFSRLGIFKEGDTFQSKALSKALKIEGIFVD